MLRIIASFRFTAPCVVVCFISLLGRHYFAVGPKSSGITFEESNNVLPEANEISRHGPGDLLKNKFCQILDLQVNDV